MSEENRYTPRYVLDFIEENNAEIMEDDNWNRLVNMIYCLYENGRIKPDREKIFLEEIQKRWPSGLDFSKFIEDKYPLKKEKKGAVLLTRFHNGYVTRRRNDGLFVYLWLKQKLTGEGEK